MVDVGPDPLVFNVDKIAIENNNFRTVIWTGDNLQVTVMSINVGKDIGAEIHPDTDQFIKIVSGRAKILIGSSAQDYYYQRIVDSSFAIIIPAGVWHNIENMGDNPLKLYSIYAPPHHPHGILNTEK